MVKGEEGGLGEDRGCPNWGGKVDITKNNKSIQCWLLSCLTSFVRGRTPEQNAQLVGDSSAIKGHVVSRRVIGPEHMSNLTHACVHTGASQPRAWRVF